MDRTRSGEVIVMGDKSRLLKPRRQDVCVKQSGSRLTWRHAQLTDNQHVQSSSRTKRASDSHMCTCADYDGMRAQRCTPSVQSTHVLMRGVHTAPHMPHRQLHNNRLHSRLDHDAAPREGAQGTATWDHRPNHAQSHPVHPRDVRDTHLW